MRIKPLFAFFSLLLFIFSAVAAPTPTPTPTPQPAQSFSDALRRYQQTGPEWQALKSVRQSAKHHLREARGKFMPQVYLQGQKVDSKNIFEFGPTTVVSEMQTYTAQAVLEQPILTGGGNWQNLQLKKTEDQLSEVKWVQAKNGLTEKLMAATLRALVAQEMVKTLKNSQATQKRFLSITESRRRSGAALAFELAQARADFASYEARILSADNEERMAMRDIKALMGFDPDYPLQLSWPKLKKQEFVLAFKDNLRERLDIIQATHEVAKAKHAKRLSLAQDLPSLSFRASVGYQNDELSQLSEEENKIHNYMFMLNVPIFSGGTGLQRRQAGEALRFAAEKDLRSRERDAANDLLATRESYISAQRNLESNREWAKNAQEAIRLGLENYRVGRLVLLQVLQLQAGYERAELSRIESERQALFAELAFFKARGLDLYDIYTKH